MRLRAWLAPAILFLFLASAASAADLYVSKSGNDTTGDGSSGNPFLTIQRAVDVSVAGDTVHVLAGTYGECVDARGKVVTLHAEDTTPANTTIDGTGLDCGSGGFAGPTVALGDGCKLEGFTVKGGGDSGVFAEGSVSITNNVITENIAGYGGGIFYVSDDLTAGTTAAVISGNTITGNIASYDGGGLWVTATDTDGVLREVQITSNVITQNTADGLDAVAGGHGGGVVFYVSTDATGVAKIVATLNTIDGNSVTTGDPCIPSYGGGLWAVTFGAGSETIEIADNQILNNSSRGEGGGASVWISPEPLAAAPVHTITFTGNTVSANDATAGGAGGLDLYLLAQDLPASATVAFTVSDNEVTGNASSGAVEICGPEQASQVLGGGGMLATYLALRTDASGIAFDVDDNTLRSNSNDFEGGGAKVFVYADSDPDFDGVFTGRATSRVSFDHNLVTSNGTHDPVGNLSDSGGVAVGLQSFGDADASAVLSFDTVSLNSTDALGAAGIGITSFTDFDFPGTFDGVASVTIENSIVSGNLAGYGIGALAPLGTANLTIDVLYSDVFGNATGDYGPVVGNRTGTDGNISADPLFDPLFLPDVCSPTIDAADPAADFTLEPAPNGFRANMGHFGATEGAATSLPDINGDDVVDGVEILAIATSFASYEDDPGRYNPAADLDQLPDPDHGDLKDVDGDDLALVSAHFGRSCQP
jgi:hypothetical protein